MPDATYIPDEEVAGWPGARRLVIGPPAGHDLTGDIRAVEAIVDEGTWGRRFSTRWIFSDEEITRLAAGDPVYLTFYGDAMAPVALSFLEPVDGPPKEVPPPAWNACPLVHGAYRPERPDDPDDPLSKDKRPGDDGWG